MSRRFTALLVLALVAIATASIAALGSSNASAGAEARALGAVAVPAEALAYASVNADRDGAAWQQLEVLAARVPGGADALKQLDARMDGDGAAMDALGGDISVGLLGVDVAGGSADAIVVATAADGAKLTQELERMGFVEGPDLNGAKVWEKDAFAVSVDGPVAIAATSRATLRTALAARSGAAPALADDDAFRATLAKLPDDPLAVAYLSPARLAPLVSAATALLPEQGDAAALPVAELVDSLNDVRGLAIAISAEEDGVRISAAGDADEAALEASGVRLPETFSPSLAARVPADAAGFATFSDLGPTLLALIEQVGGSSNQITEGIASLELATGLALRGDLVPALSGQHALVALPGDEPRGALLLAPQDVDKAGTTLGTASTFLRDLMPDADDEIVVTREQDGDVIAIGNVPSLAGTPERSLADTDGYRAVLDAAGVPDAVTGLAFVDGAQVRAAAERKTAKPLPEALKALRGVVAWGTDDAGSLFIAVG